MENNHNDDNRLSNETPHGLNIEESAVEEDVELPQYFEVLCEDGGTYAGMLIS